MKISYERRRRRRISDWVFFFFFFAIKRKGNVIVVVINIINNVSMKIYGKLPLKMCFEFQHWIELKHNAKRTERNFPIDIDSCCCCCCCCLMVADWRLKKGVIGVIVLVFVMNFHYRTVRRRGAVLSSEEREKRTRFYWKTLKNIKRIALRIAIRFISGFWQDYERQRVSANSKVKESMREWFIRGGEKKERELRSQAIINDR